MSLKYSIEEFASHWWCVLIDRPIKLYGEFDSLRKDRRSDYVFQVLCREFKTANIDISSFRRLSQEEREKLPSQGQNVFDCGVFVLGFISAFVHNLEMNFSLRDMPFQWNSFSRLKHCAGENSSARIGEDGIKKCRTGVSPFSPDKTMEEVSVGFGVAFPGKYELGDFYGRPSAPKIQGSQIDQQIQSWSKDQL